MKPKLKIFLPVFVLALLLVFWRLRATRNAAPIRVETAVATRADVEATVSASGKIEPFSTLDVKSKAGGTILKMAVEEGTRVKRGQLICLIDRRDNLASYNQAAADVQAARAALQQAQAGAQLQSESLGPQIEQAQQTVVASRAHLTSARSALQQQREAGIAQIRQSQASVASARAQLQSALEGAGAQPLLTRSGLDSARAGVASSQANLRSARENGRSLQTAALPQAKAAAKSQIDQTKSNLVAAQSALQRQQTLFEQGAVARNTVESAQNQLDLTRAALENAQSRLDTLGAEQESQKRDALAKIAAAQAALASSRAALAQASANRVQERVKTSDASAARASLRQAQAVLTASVAQSRQIAQREADVSAALATLRQNEAALQVARANRLQNVVKGADVASSRANLQKAGQEAEQRARNLAQTVVTAPRDGVVLQKYVDTGAIIQSGESGFSGGTSIVQLADLRRVYVVAQVDESDIGQIRVGQKVRVTLDAYPEKPFLGRVRKIFPTALAENNITFVKVQVEMLVSDARLRPSLNATCDFELQNRRDVLSVPLEAIREEGQKTFVTLVKNSQSAAGEKANPQKREVKLGARGDDRAEILSGLRAGDKVVLPKVEPTPAPRGGPFGG
ncbi:HlyD family secretion protein [Abditibacterium utsteinense]|uniref:HlyD family secretion protein n=1 Tax=Abditibacterium utsteinense TaxID=1960156 RepID=A0A2S8SQT6_9BACT|nr:efflux RND transporter periplasmic adaptor subunit [Abditibacterium utsteinense]PQV63148.1 HlyD family secretion protein [Abditibacterium utsteinense]